MGHSVVIVNLETGTSHSLMVLPTVLTKQVLPVIFHIIVVNILVTFYMRIFGKKKKPDTSNRQVQSNAGRPFNTECPICIVRWTYGVRTNCNHAFCLECLHQSILANGLDCPVCRVRITHLQPIFGDDDLVQPVDRPVGDSRISPRLARVWRRVDPVLTTSALLLLMVQCALDGMISALPLLALLAVRTMFKPIR